MKGRIYLKGRRTKEAGKVRVYKDFGACKRCSYALDDKEAGQGLCRSCQELKT